MKLNQLSFVKTCELREMMNASADLLGATARISDEQIILIADEMRRFNASLQAILKTDAALAEAMKSEQARITHQ